MVFQGFGPSKTSLFSYKSNLNFKCWGASFWEFLFFTFYNFYSKKMDLRNPAKSSGRQNGTQHRPNGAEMFQKHTPRARLCAFVPPPTTQSDMSAHWRPKNRKEPPRTSTEPGTQTVPSTHKAWILISHNTVNLKQIHSSKTALAQIGGGRRCHTAWRIQYLKCLLETPLE